MMFSPKNVSLIKKAGAFLTAAAVTISSAAFFANHLKPLFSLFGLFKKGAFRLCALLRDVRYKNMKTLSAGL